jgi:hypothetical protein
VAKVLNYLGAGILLIGILFRIMHWPGGGISLLVGVFLLVASFVLIFFENDVSIKQSNSDILDDI